MGNHRDQRSAEPAAQPTTGALQESHLRLLANVTAGRRDYGGSMRPGLRTTAGSP